MMFCGQFGLGHFDHFSLQTLNLFAANVVWKVQIVQNMPPFTPLIAVKSVNVPAAGALSPIGVLSIVELVMATPEIVPPVMFT